MFFAPLYLAGPLLPAAEYNQQMAALAATQGGNGGSSAAGVAPKPAKQALPAWAAPAALQLAAWVAVVELARRSFYAPEVLLPRLSSLW